MKSFVKTCAMVLLLINATGALFGGANLIIHPDGGSMKLSMEWLRYTPFDNYLIPGIILVIANGVFSVAAFVAAYFKVGRYPLYFFAQGAILTGWIVIQILLIRTIIGLHFVMGGIGILLMICGWLLRSKEAGKQANVIKL